MNLSCSSIWQYIILIVINNHYINYDYPYENSVSDKYSDNNNDSNGSDTNNNSKNNSNCGDYNNNNNNWIEDDDKLIAMKDERWKTKFLRLWLK